MPRTTLKGAPGSRSWTFQAPDGSFTVRVGEHAMGYRTEVSLHTLGKTIAHHIEAEGWEDVDRSMRSLGAKLETFGKALQSVKLEDPR